MLEFLNSVSHATFEQGAKELLQSGTIAVTADNVDALSDGPGVALITGPINTYRHSVISLRAELRGDINRQKDCNMQVLTGVSGPLAKGLKQHLELHHPIANRQRGLLSHAFGCNRDS